jgi:hypothetical protein
MQQLTVTLNLKRGLCRISTPLYLGGEYAVSYTPNGAYSLVMTEPFADSPKDGIVVWAQTDSGNTLRLTRKALHNAFVRSDSRQPGMTLSAKVFVLNESGATVADGTATIEFTPAQYIIDDAEYPTAREVLGQAQNAVSEAKHSVLMAQTAQSGAEGAKSEAQTAKSAAEDAKSAAEDAAQAAANNASQAKASADTAKAAKNAAETAQAAAETAKSKAQSAADNASTAATEAVKAETDRATTAEEEIRKRLAALVGEDAGKTIREIADAVASALISVVVGGAPEAFDTLKEIADWIRSDVSGAQAIINQVAGLTEKVAKKADTTAVANLLNGKVNKVKGKDLSTNDYTDADRDKLAGIEAGAQKNPDLTPYAKKNELKLKRDKTDNVASADSAEFTEWKFHCDVPEIQAALDENPPAIQRFSDPAVPDATDTWILNGLPAVEGYGSGQLTPDEPYDANAVCLTFGRAYVSNASETRYTITATRERTVIAKSGEPYVTPTGVKNIAIPKYEFVMGGLKDDGAGGYLVTLEPYHCTVLIGKDLKWPYFKIEAGGGSGKVRDFTLMVDLTMMADPPTITWPSNFHPRTDAETDFACVAGVKNIYWITEYAPNEFCVACWQETTGGNAQ